MRRLGWVAACVLLVMEGSNTVLAHWEAAPLSQMVDEAQRVFVGRLSEITSDSKTDRPSSIELRFTVEWSIDDALSPGDQTTLISNHAILQDWGANDNGHISWETGRRYLIFAGSPTGGRPVTYENSVLAVVEGNDWAHYPVTLDWRAIRGVQGGLLRPTRRAIAISDELAELVPSMAQQIEPIDTTPDGSSWCIRDTNIAPAMTLEALLEKVAGHYGRSAPPLDLAFDGAMLPPPPERGGLPCICDVPIELPVVMEQIAPSHWSYLQNAYAMSRFNDTVDVFRSTPGNDTWSHGEGIYEFAGWPSAESCQLVYGDPNWNWGFKIANSRTIYYFYCGGLIESSVTFNPYVSWEKDFHVGGAYHYGNVLMHELGHVVGLQQVNCEPVESYTFDVPSIMMAASRSVVEDGRGLHMIDALLLRSFYDGIQPTPAFHDIGVESWWANGHPKSTEVEPAVVTAGEEITLDRFTVENIGTSAVYDIRVQIYLSENTTITTSDIKLGNKVRLTHLNQAGIWEGGATRTIPWWVQAGTYYVGLRVSIGASASGDDYVFNNATYLTSPITVQAGDPPPPVLVTHLFDAIPAGWSVWFNSMSQEDLDDPPGYCGGVVTTGPGQAWDFDVPEDGELEVSNLESAAPAPREDTPDMIQIRRQVEGGWETLGLQCDSSGNGPVRVQVEAGDHVEVRLFTQEDETVAGWYEIVWTPDMPWGSSPGTAIPYQHPLDLSNAEMPDVSIPLPCAENSTQAIWYRWKAPATGLVNVTTCGQHTSVDTVLSIHLDTPTLDLVGCDDDSCDGGGSTVIFEALEGTEYLIRTASSSGVGNIHLSIKTAPLPGEHITCNDAQSISSLGIYSTQTGGNASASDCDGELSDGPIAWVSVTPPADAAWRLSLCQDDGGQASSLGAMALYETCTSAQPIKCAQTQDCNGAPVIDLPGGTTSLVQIRGSGNLDGTHGPLTALLAVVETPPPPCLADLNEDGQVGIDDLLALLDVYGTPGADIDGNGVSDINDLLLILNAWGGCP